MRKVSSNSNHEQSANKVTKLLTISALIMFILSITVCVITIVMLNDNKKAYDEQLVEECEKDLTLFLDDMGIDNPFDEIFDFEVTYNSRLNEYTVSDNLGEPCTIELGEEPDVSSPPEETKPIKNKSLLNTIKKSKELVFKYIKNSKILKDKDKIYDYIDSLTFEYFSLEYNDFFINLDFVDTVACYFKDHIYLNPVNENLFCEWIFVHEMIHAITDFTHGFVADEYHYTLFDECMTEIITYSLNPELIEESAYFEYIDYVVPYVGIFGEKAIYAYFYNYNPIYEVYPKDSFSLYVKSVENLYEDDFAYFMAVRSLGKMSALTF